MPSNLLGRKVYIQGRIYHGAVGAIAPLPFGLEASTIFSQLLYNYCYNNISLNDQEKISMMWNSLH